MQSFLLTFLLGLLCLLVVQANVFVLWYLYRLAVFHKIKDRFVKVDSLAALHELDNPEPYRPNEPPEVPNLWGDE